VGPRLPSQPLLTLLAENQRCDSDPHRRRTCPVGPVIDSILGSGCFDLSLGAFSVGAAALCGVYVDVLLIALIPGDIARTIAGPQATDQQYLALKRSLGLDESLPIRYWHWLEQACMATSALHCFSTVCYIAAEQPPARNSYARNWLHASRAIIGVGLGIGGAILRGKAARSLT